MLAKGVVQKFKKYEGREITEHFHYYKAGDFPVRYYLKAINNHKVIVSCSQSGRAWELEFTPSEFAKLVNKD